MGRGSPYPVLIMNKSNTFTPMTDTFMKSFVNTLVFNIATIVAVIVATVSYAYRATRVWYNEGGKQVLINNACKCMAFVNKMAEQAYYRLEDAEIAAA